LNSTKNTPDKHIAVEDKNICRHFTFVQKLTVTLSLYETIEQVKRLSLSL